VKPWMGAVAGAMVPLSFIAMTWLPPEIADLISAFITRYAAPTLMVMCGGIFGYNIVASKRWEK